MLLQLVYLEILGPIGKSKTWSCGRSDLPLLTVETFVRRCKFYNFQLVLVLFINFQYFFHHFIATDDMMQEMLQFYLEKNESPLKNHRIYTLWIDFVCGSNSWLLRVMPQWIEEVKLTPAKVSHSHFLFLLFQPHWRKNKYKLSIVCFNI